MLRGGCERRRRHKRPRSLIAVTRSPRMNALSTFWTLAVTLSQTLADSTEPVSLGELAHTPNFLVLHV